MGIITDNKTFTFFNSLHDEAETEGTVGVEDERLIWRALKKPSVYINKVRSRLEEIDESYTPKTYKLFSELYMYLTKDM